MKKGRYKQQLEIRMACKCDKMKNFSSVMRVENTCVVRFRNEGEFKNLSRIYLSKNIV